MRIAYVIDNIEHTLAQVLNYLLGQQEAQRLDVVKAHFRMRRFERLGREELHLVCFEYIV